MDKKITLACILSSLLTTAFAASDFDIDELKAKARQYTGGKGNSSKIEDVIVEPPRSRFINNSSNQPISEEDKRHILVHMKLANRHFSKKNYEKAIEEVESVFQRNPSHSGGHFMLAVISGRQKDYNKAWYHITIAKEKENNNPKINDFINKLKTVSPSPSSSNWVPGIYNGLPIDISEKAFDIIENLLNDECSQNITEIAFSDYSKEGNNSSFEITFKSLDPFAPKSIVSVIQKNCNMVLTRESADKNLKIKITFCQLNAENQNCKTLKGINEFIADLTEEMPEIAISNTEEADANGGNKEIIYEISTREFFSLNRFLRKISPYAKKYILQNMELAFVPGTQTTMWKAKIKIIYKV